MKNTRLVTPELQCSFPSVFVPKAPVEGAKEKYTITVLIPKSDTELIAQINSAVDAAIAEGVSKKWGGKTPNKSTLRPVLKDGDEKDRAEFHGNWLLTASTTVAPEVVDASLNAITDPNAIVGGDYVRISCNFGAYFVGGNKGISCYLQNVMLARKTDKPFSNKIDASSDFANSNNKNFL